MRHGKRRICCPKAVFKTSQDEIETVLERGILIQ
jgi:hypothetical protein